MNAQTRTPLSRTGRVLLAALVPALVVVAGAGPAAADVAPSSGPPEFIEPTAPPAAIVNEGYSFRLAVASGLRVTCSVTDGSLPDGITLRSDCVLLGTPTTVGTSSFTITATNGVAPDPVLPLSLTVNERPGLSSTEVPHATVGEEYSYQLPLTGSGPLTVTEIGPDHLPDGLTLDPDGLVHGVPTTAATLFGWGLRLDGAAGSTPVSLWFTVDGVAPGAIPAPPDAVLGRPYSFTFTTSGSPAPYVSVNGILPPGLTYDVNTSTLSGTPTQPGSYDLVVTAGNIAGSSSRTVTVTVVGTAPDITDTPPGGTVGVPYSFAFQAPGANPTPTYTVTSGRLPLGLTLYANGVITGTPTAVTAGSQVTVTATNAVGSDDVTFTLPVAGSSPTITGTPPTGVDQYLSYSYQYAVRGVPTPTVTVSGNLPPGLTLDDSGYLSGFPSTPGTYTFTVTASNGNSPDASVTSTVVVNGPPPPPPPSQTISGTPPVAGVGEPYSFAFTTTGSPRVTKSAGSLPPGLSLSSTGRLSGTPTRAGSYSFTVRAVAGSATPGTQSVTLVVQPAPRVSVSCVAVLEGTSGTHPLTVTITLSRASSVPVTVSWTTANGTAVSGSDYVAASGTVSFAPGQTSTTVTVPVRGDRTHERDEYFLVRLASPSHATIDRGTAVATIRNDD